MKAFLRWLIKIFSSVIIISLLIILFPYISRIAERLLPDESASAIKASVVLSSKLEESARLETLKVQDEGVLNYQIQAAFLGTVAQINLSYRYEASFGLDLRDVEMKVSGSTITFLLPAPELIQDVLTPLDIQKDAFWYPGFSEEDYEELLENERLTRRNAYLHGEQYETLWDASQRAFETTIATWLTEMDSSITTHYERKADCAN